jgi:uncharacterized membrane protein
MKIFKKIVLFVFLVSVSIVAFTQTNNTVEMADTMRSNGKIYIVVAVCLTILIGLFLYVLRIDRKVSAFERSSKE